MIKVSKNIKQFRKQKGLTQEALADKMNITRQAISNWENNRTQPDVESLEKLSEIFEVRIEEIIYGKNKFIESENDKTRQKNVMKIFLSVFGSLFIGIGFVLLFFFFWEKFPLTIKTVFSLIPLLVGQAFSVFVYLKKNDSLIWRESAATVWCIGVISTVALINGIYDIHFGYEKCLLIDALLCLPVFYIFNSVAPIAPYYYMIIHWSIHYRHFIIGFILLALGYLFMLYNKADILKGRIKYVIWISVISALCYIPLALSVILNANVIILVYAIFLCLFILSKAQPNYSLPFYTLGLFGSALLSIIFSYDSAVYSLVQHGYSEAAVMKYIIFAASLVLSGICLFINRSSYKENLIKLLTTVFALLHIVFIFIYDCLISLHSPLKIFDTEIKPSNTVIILILVLPAAAVGISLVIESVKKLKPVECNLGIFMLFSVIIRIIIGFADVNILILSIVFILFGLVLIAANTRLTSKKKEMNSTFEIKGEEAEADE